MLREMLMALSESTMARRFVKRAPGARTMARRFVAGETVDDGIRAARALNQAMQVLLREWHQCNSAAPGADAADRRFLDQFAIGWFHEMNRALNDRLDDAAFAQRLHDNVARMRWLAADLRQRAQAQHPGIGDHGLAALLGDACGAATTEALTAVLPSAWYGVAGLQTQASPVVTDDA